jgi:hypothetical protein
MQPAAPAARNGLGLAAAIVAPIGILFGLVPLTGFIAVICALVAIPLALVGRSRVCRGRATNGKTAMTGLVLGAGALALGVWGITVVFGAVDQLAEDLSGPAPIAAPAAPGPAGEQPVIEAEQPAGAAAPAVAAFVGQRVTFDDGLAVEVTAPEPYKPGRYAAGHDGDRAVRFDITVVNGSEEPYDAVMTVVNATHGGRQVSRIFDSANGGSENPAGTVLPGKSTTFSSSRRQIRRVLASQAGRSIRSPTGRPRAAAWVSWTMTPRYRAGCRSSRSHPSPNASRITVSLI